MKPIKPGESTTIRFVFDPSKKREDYDLVLEFELPDPTNVTMKRTYTILLDLDQGVDEK